MGRTCLFTSLIGFCFGIGTLSADFQEGGKRGNLIEYWPSYLGN